jgi:nitrogen fixation/metabolism regulation signal transduction histidine kinase
LAEQQHSANLDRVFSGISRRIHHLSEFVKGYGELARIGQPQLEAVQLNSLLEDVQTLYNFAFTAHVNIREIQADKAQMEQVLINLIKNAIEASPPDMPVLVSLQQYKHSVQVCIDDNGSGIPEHILHQVMLPYYTTKPQGTGVGLAICRNIIDSHKGRLILKNRQNGGLRAMIELPS